MSACSTNNEASAVFFTELVVGWLTITVLVIAELNDSRLAALGLVRAVLLSPVLCITELLIRELVISESMVAERGARCWNIDPIKQGG